MRPNGRQSVWNRIVVRLQLNVVARAVAHLYVTDDRRPTARFIGESKRRDRIERGKNVALARNQSSSECRVKVVFGAKTPSEELFGLAIARFCGKSRWVRLDSISLVSVIVSSSSKRMIRLKSLMPVT